MSLAKRILPILPKLRRFGQMLTVSPIVADELVKACLHDVIDNPKLLPSDDNIAQDLFRMFLARANNDGSWHSKIEESGLGDLANEFLAGLTLVERQTFLLLYVEKFKRKQVAHIMGIAKEDVKVLEKRVSRKMSLA